MSRLFCFSLFDGVTSGKLLYMSKTAARTITNQRRDERKKRR
ncbi:hypothetical protein HMPREF1620_00014 [Escherichia coli 909945-2]|nr:hypothetical protein HMPREF1620_00014 [Escherichia coli 909945-2]